MSARKRIRAITCIDGEAVLTGEDDAALVDALGKRGPDASEDRRQDPRAGGNGSGSEPTLR